MHRAQLRGRKLNLIGRRLPRRRLRIRMVKDNQRSNCLKGLKSLVDDDINAARHSHATALPSALCVKTSKSLPPLDGQADTDHATCIHVSGRFGLRS